MPGPSFMVEQEDLSQNSKSSESSSVQNSVFSNPFRVKEDKKKAVLEQHVKLTTKQEDMRMIEGKKVCWNFRKGRCRFGSKCTFAHDNDVKSTVMKGSDAKPDPKVTISAPGDRDPASTSLPAALRNNKNYDDDAVISHNKKKRPGLSDSLVPGKKAMKFHDKVYKGNS